MLRPSLVLCSVLSQQLCLFLLAALRDELDSLAVIRLQDLMLEHLNILRSVRDVSAYFTQTGAL
jgi:hypothetical protein